MFQPTRVELEDHSDQSSARFDINPLQNFSNWLLERALEHSDAALLDLLLSNHSKERNSDTIDRCLYEAFLHLDCLNKKLRKTQYQFLHKMAEQQLEVIATSEMADRSVFPDWEETDQLLQNFVGRYIEDAKRTYRNEVLEGRRLIVDYKGKRLIKGKKDQKLLESYMQKLGEDLKKSWQEIIINCQKETASISKKDAQVKHLTGLARKKITEAIEKKDLAEKECYEANRQWNERESKIKTPRAKWSKKIPELLHSSDSILMGCYEEYHTELKSKAKETGKVEKSQKELQKEFIQKVLEASIPLSWQDAEGKSLYERVEENQTDNEKCGAMFRVLRKCNVSDFDTQKLDPTQQKICSLLSIGDYSVSRLFDKIPSKIREEFASPLEKSILFSFVLRARQELLQKVETYLEDKIKENAKIKSKQKFDYLKIVDDILVVYKKEKLSDAIKKILDANLTQYMEGKKPRYELFIQIDAIYPEEINEQMTLSMQAFFTKIRQAFSESKKTLRKVKKTLKKKNGTIPTLPELNAEILKTLRKEIETKQTAQTKEENKLVKALETWQKEQKKQTKKLVQWFDADTSKNYFPHTFVGKLDDDSIVLQIQHHSVLIELGTTKVAFVEIVGSAIRRNPALKDEIALEIEEKAGKGRLPQSLETVTSASDHARTCQRSNNQELIQRAVTDLRQTAKDNIPTYLGALLEEGQEPGVQSIEIYCAEQRICLYIWQQESGTSQVKLFKETARQSQIAIKAHLLYTIEGIMRALVDFTPWFDQLSREIPSIITAPFLIHLASKKDGENLANMLNMAGDIKGQEMEHLIEACARIPLLLVKLLESHHFDLPQVIDFSQDKEKEHIEFVRSKLKEYRDYLLKCLKGKNRLWFYSKIPQCMLCLHKICTAYKKAISRGDLAITKGIKKSLIENISIDNDPWWLSWIENLLNRNLNVSKVILRLKKARSEISKNLNTITEEKDPNARFTYAQWSQEQTEKSRRRFERVCRKDILKEDINYNRKERRQTKEIEMLKKDNIATHREIQSLKENAKKDKEELTNKVDTLKREKQTLERINQDLRKVNERVIEDNQELKQKQERDKQELEQKTQELERKQERDKKAMQQDMQELREENAELRRALKAFMQQRTQQESKNQEEKREGKHFSWKKSQQ